MKIKIHNLEDMVRLGKILSENINDQSIICLTGDLGAGKTTLTQAIMKGLGIDEPITSPTYTTVNEYDNSIKIFHFDVYRINDIDEMFEIGFDDYMDQKAIKIIEWANIIEEIIPEDSIWINIIYTDDANERLVEINGIDLEVYYDSIGN
ncbi:MAG: tRNA (adenosine(37)-N6)-threonylcarbamoyltransferase complex ATPase subunit type 1 TsaE [Clostridiales bacterium]|nr:tRNA (adenosine(37)-N6)-threonylcarbamoyltransferase complex ATPase subunit type 1 TsaE [Clostridiales bacterium]